MMNRPPTALQHLAVALTCLLLFYAGFLVYGSTGHDDSHITFWAAHTLLTEGHIRNYNGDAVEQSSSLLMTLLVAAFSWLSHLDVVRSGYLLAIVASLLCVAMLYRAARRLLPPYWQVWTAVLLTVSCSFQLWSWSGMESTLAALCLLLMLASWATLLGGSRPTSTRRVFAVGSTTATLLVRPEMVLLVPAIAAVSTAWYRRRALPVLLMSLLLAGLVLAWRHSTFGAWFPQPVEAKTGGALQWRAGLWYLLLGSLLNPVLFACLPALPGALLSIGRREADPLLTLSLLALLAYCGFIVLSGGDWMQAARFLVPIIPLACLIAVQGASRLCWQPLAHGLMVLLLAAQIGMHFISIKQLSSGIPVWASYRISDTHRQQYSLFEQLNQEHLRDMGTIDQLDQLIRTLRPHSDRPLEILSGQAGMVFFYTAQQHTGSVHFLDLHGLADRQLTQCAALSRIPRGSQGLFWSYADFFGKTGQLQQCGIALPDIIFDLNDMARSLPKTLVSLDYTLIYREQGFMVENDSTLPYNRLMAPDLIFVHNRWLPYLTSSEPTILNYASLPLQRR